MNLQSCSAAVVLGDLDGAVLFFGRPELTLRGGWKDWGVLEKVLAERSGECADSICPPGGLVGAVAYDGSFEFHLCPEVRLGDSDELFPERMEDSPGRGADSSREWRSETGRAAFMEMVRASQEAIRRGDIYQINLTRKLFLDLPGLDGRRLFRHLWQRTAAPCSAFLELSGRMLLCASPELFLDISGRRILTQPIKGTRPRDSDGNRDERNAFELRTDPKEIAELVMITDLERNDLGQVCEFGSVRVSDLVVSRSFSHVHHLVSTVEGRLRPGITPVEALRACYPGGSITGAPKRKAMEIIRDLEPQERGFYTGAIGYFGFDGSARFSMAIRTLECESGRLSFGVGSGITIDSDPGREFEETGHKAAAMMQALESYFGAGKTHARDGAESLET